MGKDNDDLEALFDEISNETLSRLGAVPQMHESSDGTVSSPAVTPNLGLNAHLSVDTHTEPIEDTDEFYKRVGGLTRQLHNALRELGFERDVEEVVSSLPDTRDRLDYIAKLTGKAAERTLANVEKGQAVQSDFEKQVKSLRNSWDKLYARELSVEEFKQVALATHQFLKMSEDSSQTTQAILTDIMMAQDFHDLTGQVIQKVLNLAQFIEDSLLRLLVDATPTEKRNVIASVQGHGGPVINAEGRDDVVTDQTQVDDLLDSLGF